MAALASQDSPKARLICPDAALLAAWRAGDLAAGNELFERYFDVVYGFFSARGSDRLEDLVQQTFLACVEGRDRFRGDATFRTYLYSIAINVLRADRRRCGRDARRVGSGVSHVEDQADSPSRLVAGKQERDLLLAALTRVPEPFRRPVELYYFHDLRGPEIAGLLDLAEGTVRSRIRRGTERLRAILVEEGAFGLALALEEHAS